MNKIKKKTKITLSVLMMALATISARAEHAGHDMANHSHISNEPIGVMGAHAHSTGDWMFSYRFMRMDMEGNRDGTDRLSTRDVLSEYMIAP